jgi:GGDEF domain-containing protein
MYRQKPLDTGTPIQVPAYIEDISEQRAAAASILRLAHYDTLTELPNRTLFQERLGTAVEAAERDAPVQ